MYKVTRWDYQIIQHIPTFDYASRNIPWLKYFSCKTSATDTQYTSLLYRNYFSSRAALITTKLNCVKIQFLLLKKTAIKTSVYAFNFPILSPTYMKLVRH